VSAHPVRDRDKPQGVVDDEAVFVRGPDAAFFRYA
jgi:hypothetical protein